MSNKLYSIDFLDAENINYPITRSIDIQLADSSPVVFRIGSINLLCNDYKSCRIILIDLYNNPAKACKVTIEHDGVDENGNAYKYSNIQYCYEGYIDIEHYKCHDNTILITSDYYNDFTYNMLSSEYEDNPIITIQVTPKVNLIKGVNYLRIHKKCLESYNGFKPNNFFNITLLADEFTSGYWRSSVKYNNILIGIPASSPDILLFNTVNETYTLRSTGLAITGNSKYRCGVVTSNGILYAFPFDATKILKYDIDNDILSFIGDFTGRSLRYDSCTISNNKIYAIPALDSAIMILDLSNDNVTLLESLPSVGNKYATCITVNDYVYALPSSETKILKIHTLSNTISFIETNDITTQKWTSCILYDSIIYGIPFDHNNIIALDTRTDTFKLIGEFTKSDNKWHKCVEKNGIIYGIPAKHESFLIFNIESYASKLVGDFTTIDNKWWSGDIFGDIIYGLPSNIVTNIIKFNTNTYIGNDVILDLKSDTNVYVDSNNHIKQWKSVVSDVVFNIPSSATGINLLNNNGIISTPIDSSQCFAYDDKNYELFDKHSFKISGLHDFTYLIDNPSYVATLECTVLFNYGYNIPTGDSRYFSYGCSVENITLTHLQLILYISLENASFHVAYINIPRNMLSSNNQLDIVISDKTILVSIDKVVLYKSMMLSYFSKPIFDYHILFINGMTYTTYSKSNTNYPLKRFTLTKNHNIDLSQYSVNDTITELPNLDLLPISRYNNNLYLSTYNKNTLTHDNVDVTKITNWKSDSNTDKLTDTNNYMSLTNEGIKFISGVFTDNLYDISDDFTIELWVKLDTLSYQMFLQTGIATPPLAIALNNGVFVLRNNNVDTIISNVTGVVNKWYHLAVSKINNIQYFFINGIYVGYYENNLTSTYKIGVGNPYNIKIDDVYFGKLKYNIAAVELNDYAFIPPRRNSNMLPENIQWIDSNDKDNVIVALSSKNNVTVETDGINFYVSSWKDVFNDLLFSSSNHPKLVKNEGLVFDTSTYLNGQTLNLSVYTDVTIDCWIKVTSYSGILNMLFGQWDHNVFYNSTFGLYITSSILYGIFGYNNTYTQIGFPVSDIIYGWNHISFGKIRINDTQDMVYLTKNGIIKAKIILNKFTINNSTIPMVINKNGTPYTKANFNIDQLRIVGRNSFNLKGNEQVGDKIF